ncbi:MAG: 3-deoxy-D-manno-octulosonic acid transferase [Lysobacterales bacterium]|nr:MAG: 3-deoxy-D-manno-octulosonic acid transferase [Xanthomonadales bacterium]
MLAPMDHGEPLPHPLLRAAYTALMYLLTPVILWRLALRGLRYRDYFKRWPERFGFFADPGIEESIWVHAVSVGEFNAAVPLIEAMMERWPNRPVVVTTVTPTGSERVRKQFGERVLHVYLPYDLPGAIGRFLDRVRPRLAVIMETEIWPNLFFACHRRRIPVVLANGRLSERSLRGYGPIRPLARAAVRTVRAVIAQSDSDARRFLDLGADPERLTVAGNLKFDMDVPGTLPEQGRALRARWGAQRPVWIAGSTHEPEELPVLDAHARVLSRFPDALLIIAPRHPERFRPVAALCRSLGFSTAVRSQDEVPEASSQCFVLDTIGELLRFYAASDVAFVGGSLAPVGGHNVLEAAALGVPVLIGPHTFNFSEVTESLVACGGARRVLEPNLGAAVSELLGDLHLRQRMGASGQRAFERERGAVDRIMAAVESILEDQSRCPSASGGTRINRPSPNALDRSRARPPGAG